MPHDLKAKSTHIGVKPYNISMMDAHRISGAPPAMYYIPNFITAEEESHILQSVRLARFHLSFGHDPDTRVRFLLTAGSPSPTAASKLFHPA